MGRLDVKKMLAELEREEFDKWYVAYHELHLDGAGPAAIVASAVHNELMPLHAYFDLDWEPTTPEQLLPKTIFGDDKEDENDRQARQNEQLDALIAAAAQAYPSG